MKSNELIKVRHETIDFRPKLILEIDKEALQDIATLHGNDTAKESLILALKGHALDITDNCSKGTQLIHDERIVTTTKQYLINEFNKYFNEFIVYDTASPPFYDYEKHMYMKWVSASEYNKIEDAKTIKPFVCDCCWKEVPENEHRILYEASMTENPNEYRVCFECHNKLQKMPHGKNDIARSIGKIQDEGPLASQPNPIIDKEGRMENHRDFNEMALLDRFIERVKEKDPAEQIKELETARNFLSDHLTEAKSIPRPVPRRRRRRRRRAVHPPMQCGPSGWLYAGVCVDDGPALRDDPPRPSCRRASY